MNEVTLRALAMLTCCINVVDYIIINDKMLARKSTVVLFSPLRWLEKDFRLK